MRLIVIFDLPVETKQDQRNYRKFVRYLTNEGYLMIQYSVYAKLCINANSAKTASKKLKLNSPNDGDIRYLIISEGQYQNIVSINRKYSLQEEITNTNRTLMFGEMNNENS